MKNEKSDVPDEISTEVLKALGDIGIKLLLKFVHQIYNTGQISEEIGEAVFVILPKKADAMKCKDYRPISIMSHVVKYDLKYACVE